MEDDFDIVVENLSKSYITDSGSVQVFDNLSFKVKRSQIFCVVGPSGCGKSTLLKILLGLADINSGKVSIHPERKDSSAYVQQHPSLLPWRTVLQNAALGAEVREGINKADITRMRGQLKEFGLKGFEDKFPAELSGGMKQRVNIISALESRPSLLYCDEPFSAIDFVTRLELNNTFKRECRVGKMTTIFVTHNIEEAIFLGDAVMVLSGRPARVVQTHIPDLNEHQRDAIKCRETTRFQQLFQEIWDDLKSNYEK